MNKRTLRRLGALWRIEIALYNLSVVATSTTEDMNKYKLVRKVKKQLEEQQRGFLKSLVPYSKMADYITENIEDMNYDILLKEITHIALEVS